MLIAYDIMLNRSLVNKFKYVDYVTKKYEQTVATIMGLKEEIVTLVPLDHIDNFNTVDSKIQHIIKKWQEVIKYWCMFIHQQHIVRLVEPAKNILEMKRKALEVKKITETEGLTVPVSVLDPKNTSFWRIKHIFYSYSNYLFNIELLELAEAHLDESDKEWVELEFNLEQEGRSFFMQRQTILSSEFDQIYRKYHSDSVLQDTYSININLNLNNDYEMMTELVKQRWPALNVLSIETYYSFGQWKKVSTYHITLFKSRSKSF